MKEIRIEWAIGSSTGGGYWRPDMPAARRMLQDSVARLVEQYGHGTHWLAEREA